MYSLASFSLFNILIGPNNAAVLYIVVFFPSIVSIEIINKIIYINEIIIYL